MIVYLCWGMEVRCANETTGATRIGVGRVEGRLLLLLLR